MRSRGEDNECRDCPIKEKSARISVGSLILRARALFSAETVARIRDLDLDAAKTSSRLIFRVDRSLNGVFVALGGRFRAFLHHSKAMTEPPGYP